MISSPRAREIIAETIEREQIDLAHISLSFSQLDFSLPEICHDCGVPCVATLHFPYGPPETFWGSAVRVLYRLYSGSLKNYDAVIVFSESQRAMLVDYGVSPDCVRVIPNGIDVTTYAPGPSDYKESIGASVLTAYIGRVDPEKNVRDFLKAFHALDLPGNHKAVIVGNGMDLRVCAANIVTTIGLFSRVTSANCASASAFCARRTFSSCPPPSRIVAGDA